MAQIFVPQPSPPRRSWGGYIATATVVALTVLGLTNPDQEACSYYSGQKLKAKICEQKSVTGVLCSVIVPLPTAAIALTASTHTYRDNYLLFSIYRTKFMDTEVQTLGIAGRCL